MADPAPITYSNFKVPQDILPIVGSNGTGTGLQKGHIVSKVLAKLFAGNWFVSLLGEAGADSGINIVLLPNNKRGGAAFNVAVHLGKHVEGFDALFYDPPGSAGYDGSRKFLNVFEQKLDLRSAGQ